eukprot:TRINITY_DN4856_c0_g1_i5.p1 TRINITY_DN4856_c0_g1~~TRINITY_DN4856_c0_g1_i5.p1  ORF type:complete len:1289 (+),score=321.23 TRINITY_DN4856_c0_g1_i5:403-4269(+)
MFESFCPPECDIVFFKVPLLQMVSEPEKWGYSRDRKKVFVYFYGTKQIGFCNPADVEPFTEEKKKTLKRQGKGADFVLAVDEIIDSYEKSKRRNQDEINAGDEGTYGSSEGSKGRYSMKSETPSPLLVQPSQPETSYASLGRSDSSNAVETPVICMEADVLQDAETVSEEPMKMTLLQSYVVQRRPPSVRKTRSSSRVDLSKFHKPVVPVADVVKSSADVASNAISDESMTSKLIRKSSDCSISAAFVFNCSSEDVGSEIIATESEAVSFDEGSTQDSGYKIEHSETVTDFSENGVETSRRQELLHTNTMLLKKRRKPNRKQVTNGTVTHAELDNGMCMEAGLSKTRPKSPDICENSNVRFYETDGDAHLPLVKRARARMCNPFPEKTHVDEFVATKETPVNEVLINCSSTTSFSSDSYPAHSTSLEVKEAVNSLSPSKAHTDTTETHPLIWKGNNLLDDEAALPPSKRLHRALEAMSANLVETGCVEVPRTMEILSNVCRSSSEASSLCLAVDAKEVMHVCRSSSDYNSGCNTTPGLSLRSSPITNEVAKTNTMAKPDELVEEKSSGLRLDDCKKMSIQVETMDAKDLDGSSVYTHTIENETDSRSTMEERNTMNAEPSMNCSDNVYKGEDASCQADKPEGQECSHPILERPVSSSKADDAGNFSPVNGSGVHILDTNEGSIASDICKSMKTMSQTVESSKVRTMNGAEKEYGDRSSDADLHQMNSVHVPEMDCEGRFDSISTERQKFLGKWNDTPEANAVWKSFKAVLETLSRTKDSIGRATRVAMDCAKYGIAGEVVKLLLRSLKHEPNLNRRVDLFFLVDSITQCSRGQKGVAGDVYPPAVQAVLPQLLAAAAPSGNAARENRRQCLKVLRVWLKKKTLPEAIVRHHIRELDSFTDASLSSSFPRLPSRTERVCDDPVRGMDGMLVDEYGSNTHFHLSGFLMSRVFDDEEENSFDQQSFEAVTPEKDHEILDEPGTSMFVSEKHPHILEDVDGELEMEDVCPSFEGNSNSECCVGIDNLHTSHRQFDQQQSLAFVPPLPEDIPPSPPLPSLPPLTAHPPLPPLQSTMRHSFADAVDSLCYQGTQRMQNHLPQSMGQQPRTPNINLTALDKGPCCAPGYRDHQMHMLTPIPSFSSGSGGIVHGSNLFIQSGNDIQKFSGVTLSKALHLRPPPVTVSNQFSYLQANHHQGTPSRMAAASSSEGSQVVHEASRGHLYGHQGHSHLSRSETTYPPVSYVCPQTNYTPISSNWRSLPPRTLNYQHRVPVWRPPLESRRVNEAENFWMQR